jgi:hypothetical protein
MTLVNEKHKSAVYTLGHVQFQLQCSRIDILEASKSLFKVSDETRGLELIDLDSLQFPNDPTAPTEDSDHYSEENMIISYVITQVLEAHKKSIPSFTWLSAIALIDEQNRLVILAGDSNTGKSTLGLALCLSGQFKIVSEDLCIFDLDSNIPISYHRPISLRDGSLEVIQNCVKTKPLNLVNQRWFLDPKIFADYPSPAIVHSIIKLSPSLDLAVKQEMSNREFKVEPVSAASMLKELLPISSYMRQEQGISRLKQLLEPANCYLFTNGTLADRLKAIEEILSKDSDTGRN